MLSAPPRVRIGVSPATGRAHFEAALYRRGLGPVAGVDEAGRGACAGPMVIAACILGPKICGSLLTLDDSKKLTPKRREQLDLVIREHSDSYALVVVSPEEIDRRGLHRCNIDGMRRAVGLLDLRPGTVLSDGFSLDGFGAQSVGIIGGDQLIPSISAASVLAKVARDRIMVEHNDRFPEYGFAVHKGYGTAAHHQKIEHVGPSAIHRMTYADVQRAVVARERRGLS